MTSPLWTPAPARVAATQMTAFARAAGERHGLTDTGYAALHRWSVEQPEQFWSLLWDWCGIVASRRPDTILTGADRMPGARWFEGARLNYAENLLAGERSGDALIAYREDGARRAVGWGALRAQVAACAAGLRAMGVGRGDRVAAVLPNAPEAMVCALAAVSLGAVWSSAAPEFGAAALLDRYGQINPRVLVATNGYRYNGRRYDLRERIAAVLAELPQVAGVVAVDDGAGPPLRGDRIMAYGDVLARHAGAALAFEPVPFDHPLFILYSSGTTGKPKCIVHCTGGVLLQHVKEQRLHCDMRPGEVFFYYTTCGWTMWNWLLSGLATGTTLLLYDGNPLARGPATLLDIADTEGIDVFGVSARYLASLQKSGVRPADTHRLERLRLLLSTGSTLLPEQFDWVYSALKTDVHLVSISGGTDLCACFVGGNPNAPIWRGEIQCAQLGMDVRVYDAQGRDRPSGAGELVCTRPFPSVPLGFVGDEDGSRYRQTYFSRFPGIWAHGDYAERTVHDGFLIHGRSDATLNPGGVRIGTAEIYRQLEAIEGVIESVAIGQDWQGDTRVVLFVRLTEGHALDEALRNRICDRLRTQASPRHVPAKIVQVADLPRTLNGKLSEMAVRDAVHGRPVTNRDALANPQALDLLIGLPELNR
jgi:acetoacetyl-CoA synthetase